MKLVLFFLVANLLQFSNNFSQAFQEISNFREEHASQLNDSIKAKKEEKLSH